MQEHFAVQSPFIKQKTIKFKSPIKKVFKWFLIKIVYSTKSFHKSNIEKFTRHRNFQVSLIVSFMFNSLLGYKIYKIRR